MWSLKVEFRGSSIRVLIAKIGCNVGNGPENCQLNIVDLEGTSTQVNIYCLATVGTINMISEAGTSLAKFSDNVDVFPDLIALFQLASGTGGSGTYILSVLPFLGSGREISGNSLSHSNTVIVKLTPFRYWPHRSGYIDIGLFYSAQHNSDHIKVSSGYITEHNCIHIGFGNLA
jgi:hypothetical protein